MQLDHAVVNTQYALDRAQTAFEALGFHLTDRGYHSLGSINHLMMFTTDYLELIGLPDKPAQAGEPLPTRAGVSDAPLGINGLVFKTDSADAMFEHLQRIGMAGNPPKSFSRPVALAGEAQTRDASFRTVHVRPDCFPAGRVYFCEHYTPDLVWRPEWQSHANAAKSIAAIVLVAQEAQQQANAFASLLSTTVESVNDDEFQINCDGFAITVMSPSVYEQQYGSVAQDTGREGSFFGALKIRTTDPSAVQHAANKLGYPVHISGANHTLVLQPEFDSVLEFVTV
ncbi:MAG: VOC family protein [Burkholderiaceae bacterium]